MKAEYTQLSLAPIDVTMRTPQAWLDALEEGRQEACIWLRQHGLRPVAPAERLPTRRQAE